MCIKTYDNKFHVKCVTRHLKENTLLQFPRTFMLKTRGGAEFYRTRCGALGNFALVTLTDYANWSLILKINTLKKLL